jgi:drug/metabolite transporter (DMT)-like permease
MNSRKRFPVRLAVGLVLAVVIDTALQLVWKTAVSAVPDNGSPWINFQALLRDPLSLCVILLMACQFFNWLMVLAKADLSYAQPITSLSYVSVFVLSVVYLKEIADPVQIFGIAFILVGVWFISRTDHLTPSQGPEVQ